MVLIESKNMPDSTIDPNLSNPQALVDAALSDTTAPKPSLPTLEPLQPSEPAPVEKSPEVVVADVKVPEVKAPEVKVETNNIEMSDETPLQFVQPSEPVTQPIPLTEPVTPPLPNPPMPPSPTVVDSQAMKPKSKLGVVVGGVLILVLALGAGVWGYLGSPTEKKPAQIAEAQVADGCTENCESSGKVCIYSTTKKTYSCQKTGGQEACIHTICPVNYVCVEGGAQGTYCEPKEGGKPPGETLTCPPGTRSNGQCEDGVLRPPCCEPDTSPSPSPSTTTTATMACTGLTQTPSTTPVVGSKLTFTCSGSITPSNAGTLSYEFVYKLNAGGWKSLSNKTTNTAELTIATCGEYIVHCRACATINGSKQCDPVWKDVVIQ